MSTTAPTREELPTAFTRPSLARLSVIEFRKIFDTRSGRWFLIAIAASLVATLANYLIHADGPLVLTDVLNPADVLRLLLPALGVLSMAGEWTTRTALTTLTPVLQRGRVLTAKLAALIVDALWILMAAGIGAPILHLDHPVAPPLAALVLWVLLPLVAGTVRTLRRQVS